VRRDDNDSISAALEVIGDRWSLLILRAVFRGHHRFGEIRNDLGIASNLLTDRLNALVDHEILLRVPYQERPLRHEYRLTDAGRDLSPVLVSIMQWGDLHRSHGDRPTVLIHAECGAEIENVTRCTACGERVQAQEITAAETEAA
jgi:DNA-binding HxlR family transcriptional regulator